MNKQSLSAQEINFFAILVAEYMDPPTNSFEITGKGEVVLIKKNLIERIMNSEGGDTRDFMESVNVIITKMLEVKQIPFVQKTCRKAWNILIETNDRSAVINNLFVAHLTNEEPESGSEKPKGIEITVETQNKMIPKYHTGILQRQQSQYQLSQDIAELLNRFPGNILIRE